MKTLLLALITYLNFVPTQLIWEVTIFQPTEQDWEILDKNCFDDMGNTIVIQLLEDGFVEAACWQIQKEISNGQRRSI